MDKLEMATRQLGKAFEPKWATLNPGGRGVAFMFWDDCDHCIYADFFGTYEVGDKARIATALIATHDELGLPHSLRTGFHETEAVARKSMIERFGEEEPTSCAANPTGGSK